MKKYDCLFIGNAIVDVVANVSFEFLDANSVRMDDKLYLREY